MSAFAPMDVLTPIERRRNLLDKLMQQYQQNAASSAQQYQQQSQQNAIPAAALGMGHALRMGMPRIGPLTNITDFHALDDIAPGVRAGLGPGGFHMPLPGLDASSGVGAPVVPHPSQNPGMPGGPTMFMPLPTMPTPVGPTPVGLPSPNPQQSPNPFDPSTGFNPGGPMIPYVPPAPVNPTQPTPGPLAPSPFLPRLGKVSFS